MILLEKNLPKQIMIKHTFRISCNTHPRPEQISFLHDLHDFRLKLMHAKYVWVHVRASEFLENVKLLLASF